MDIKDTLKFDIFISYKRRGTSSATAAYIYELLSKKGYNVFFDRKEMRSGKFDEQLLDYISNAKDVLILLEKTSLASCFDNEVKDFYKSDWFCREVMHALSLQDKNIIPLLLDGYEMPDCKELPDELKELPRHQALSIDISEMDELYEKYFVEKEYLLSKPSNILQRRINKNDGIILSTFLFYYDDDYYDVFEFGNCIVTIDESYDINHPYRYGANYAGEHKFSLINHDTNETIDISTEIDPYYQKYIEIKWKLKTKMKDLTEKDIDKESDSFALSVWGEGFFMGTKTCSPNLQLARRCIDRALKKKSKRAESFIKNNWPVLVERRVLWKHRRPWIELAAGLGDDTAQRYLGNAFYNDRDYKKSCKWYKEAIKSNNIDALLDVAQIYRHNNMPYTLKKITANKATEMSELYRLIESMNDKEAIYRLANIIFDDMDERKRLLQKSGQMGFNLAYRDLGFIYFNEFDYNNAVKMFKSIEEHDLKTILYIADCYYELDEFQIAKTYYEQYLDKLKEDDIYECNKFEALIMLAQIYEKPEFLDTEKSNAYYKMYREKFEEGNDTYFWNERYYLGWIFMHGKGCQPNSEKSLYNYYSIISEPNHQPEKMNERQKKIFEKDVMELVEDDSLNTGLMLRCKGVILRDYFKNDAKGTLYLQEAVKRGDSEASLLLHPPKTMLQILREKMHANNNYEQPD